MASVVLSGRACEPMCQSRAQDDHDDDSMTMCLSNLQDDDSMNTCLSNSQDADSNESNDSMPMCPSNSNCPTRTHKMIARRCVCRTHKMMIA
jgi:hypothetical protein